MNYFIRQNIKYVIISFLIVITFSTSDISAQKDTLRFDNDNIIVGELKTLEHGVVTIETDYSDSDFKIEWEKIKDVYTESNYLISMARGINYFGRIKSTPAGNIMIITEDGQIVYHDKERIVYLNTYDKGFWDRLSASIDIGWSITKANNLKQLNIRSAVGYKARVWSLDAVFNTLVSTQDDVEDIERSEGSVNYRYVMLKNWYATATVSLLSNTEQKLDLRLNALVGLGHFMLRTNSAYWGVKLGINRNIETYSNETPNRNSWESYIGSEVNLFDFGDLSWTGDLMVYKGITASERWRADFTTDFKYDLPYDLYIKIGISYNFDNRPAKGAGEHDYVLQNGIGWEW